MGLIAKAQRAHRTTRHGLGLYERPGPMVADDVIHGVDEDTQRSLCNRDASAWFELAPVTWSPALNHACPECRANASNPRPLP
jgi:hypothetical protein